MTASADHNIVSLLESVAHRHPDRPALVFGTRTLSFRELRQGVSRCAAGFAARGLRPGHRVIMMIPMSPELYLAMLGVIRCGAAAVFVDPWIPMRQIAAFSAFAEPYAFVGIPKSHLLRFSHSRLARVPLTVTTGGTLFHLPARHSLKAMLRVDAEHRIEPVTPETPALITFTSGSSGVPKGANRTHGFLLAQYEALCQELDYREGDVDMPMFPVFALRNLAAGMTSVIPSMDFRSPSTIDAAVITRQICDNHVTLLTASPPFIDRLAEHPSPPQVRRIWTGGAPVSKEQLRKWEGAFPAAQIEIVYGSTEAEPVAHMTSQERLSLNEEKGFCCGKPTALLKTRIIQIRRGAVQPEEMERLSCPPGEIGELIVSGRHVCRDYYNNPVAVHENKILMADGTCWHRMGDTGYFDEAGRFFLTGRVHSTICRKGVLLHAQLVEEDVKRRLPEARRVAALEEEGHLVIVIQGPEIPQARERIDADRILFTRKPFPMDPRHQAKINYALLLERVQKGDL